MNSEIIGKPTDLPWSLVFERVDQIPRHPAQLYESFIYFLLFGLNLLFYRKNPRPAHGIIFGFGMIWIFGWRMVFELVKENQEPFEAGMFMNMGQLLSIPFVLLGVFLIVRAWRSRDRLPSGNRVVGA